MLSPNLTFIFFPNKQPLSTYSQDSNLNVFQSPDLSAFIHVAVMKFNIIFFAFPDSV